MLGWSVPAVALCTALAACGGADDDASPSPSSAATTTAYDPCSALSAADLEKLGGKPLPEFGDTPTPNSAWSCTRQDVLSVTDWTVRSRFELMPASQWASTYAPNLDAMSPEARRSLDAALAASGVAPSELGDLTDARACEVWRDVQDQLKAPAGEGVIGVSVVDGTRTTRAETCQRGIYAMISLETPGGPEGDVVDRVNDAMVRLLDAAGDLPPR